MTYLRILAIAFAFFVCCCGLTAGVHSPDSSRQGDYGWGSVGLADDAATGIGRTLLATGGFNGTILSNGTFAAGWEVKYNGSINIQNLTQGGINQNQALCAELPSPGDYLSFHCINCSGSGRQPFWLNKTAGFQYYLTQTNDAGYKNATVSGDAMQLILQDDEGEQLCHMSVGDTVLDKSIDDFQQIRVPFQNYPSGNQNPPKDCRDAFQNATMVGIQSLWPDVQFCVDDFQTLPSMVVTPETANASNSLEDIAPYQNCGIANLLSVTPEGNYTNVGATLPSWMHQNISAQSPADGYTLFSSVDTPFRNLISPVNGSCSIINTVNLTAINSVINNIGNNFGVCLYNASGYTDGQNGATLPSVLAKMCNNLISNVASQSGSLGLDSRCSGFAFDNATQVATFKRTNGGSTIDIPGNDEVCNLPTGVEWVRNSVLPGYVPQPGGIDLLDVYSNGLQLGWKVNSTSNITLQEVPIGINGTLAMCANMPASQSAFQFTCQDCPRNQMQPFGIGNTAGFELWIAAAQYSSSIFTVAHGASLVPSMILQLQNATGIAICDLTLTSTGVIDPSGNLYQATALYQNAQSCVAVLNQAASLSFVMNATSGAAVCVSNLTMLQSQVLDSGVASVAAIPQFPNCPVSSWTSPEEFVQPQNTSQGGNFTVTGYNATTNYNVNGSSDAQTYILYQGVDMPNSFQVNVTATNSNCSDYDIGNTTAVDQCAGQNSLCCYDSNAAHYQRGVNDSSLPAVLAQICNDLWLGHKVCQGFVYDATTGIAYFLYRQQYSFIDLSQQPTACNRPGSTMWLLKGAIFGANANDDRQPPGAAGSKSGSNIGATAGTVFGILLGVASPAAGAAAWLIFTYSYRQAKRRIVLGVFKYLIVEDVADASSLGAVNAAPDPSANVQMVDLDSRHPVRQASSLHHVLSTVASSTPLTLDIAIDDAVAGGHRVIAPSAEMKQAASEIARQCLRLWDGFLGIHAGSDSAGAKAGVWRGKFDGVRCAVLLLAFRKLNKSLQMNSDAPSCLLQAWKDCKTHRQKRELGRKIALILQGIDVTTAQNLPDKDPEVHDQPRFSWRNLMPWRPV